MQQVDPRYRSDIDGLRALAVLLVLAFHLQVPLLHGGFVGVDVFFVLSGYLITGIIANEIQASCFSIARFYERRARRILPALFAMMFSSTLVAVRYLFPGELISYAKSMLGTTFSYSNLYFLSTADYFDAAAHTKPLLHTWSLAVEEQFYVVFPLLLVLLARRWPRRRNEVLVALAVVSFALSAWLVYRWPEGAFYLPFSRAWELLAGCVLALNILPAIEKIWLREAASVAGLGLIGFAALSYSVTTPFPGVAALLPCVGSVLILAAGKHGSSAVGKILSLRPIAFVGLISYSVYLWHWPLIVFTKMGFLSLIPRQRLGYTLSITGLSLVIGGLSWRLVEQPFRVGRMRQISRGRLFRATAVAMSGSAALALLFLSFGGLQSRFPASAVRVAELADTPQEMRIGTCFITTKYSFKDFRPDICMQVDPERTNYLLLGDSHSAALWYALQNQMPGAKILQASVSGCKPVLNDSIRNDCRRMMRYIFGDFLLSHRVQGILLTARWSSEKEFENIQPTIDWCEQHKIPVYIFGPVIEYDAPLPKLLAYAIAFNDPHIAEQHMRKEFFALDAALKRKAEDEWKVRYVSIIDAECTGGLCLRYADDARTVALLGDDNHLSNAGSLLVVQKLLAAGQLPSPE